MLTLIDNWLNRITMYRLVLYFLIVLLMAAVGFSIFSLLPFSALDLVFSTLILTAVCLLTNKIFASTFSISANSESDFITALILALIITPPSVTSTNYIHGLGFLVWVAILSQASKYIVGFRGKHIFNPVVFAVVLSSLTINQSASWWVGTSSMMPLVLVGGLLVTRKIQRFDLVLTFLATALITILALSPSKDEPFLILQRILIQSPIFFFSFIMLTEPLTTPPTKRLRIGLGVLVGLFFGPSIHIGSVYSTPELALLVGNIYAYLVSPKVKYLLTLKTKEKVGPGLYDFVFESNRPLKFSAGQYLEWTLGHPKPDTRGNRRYFTIASSPTETEVHLGVKFYDPPSTFKKALKQLSPGEQILAGQLAGDFTLPGDLSKKLVFIAGGIGITPFRSMVKYLVDKREHRDIVLFYSCKTQNELAFLHTLQEGYPFGIQTIPIITEEDGHLTEQMIKHHVADFAKASYYISGSRSLVVGFEKTLKAMGIPRRHIKTDFFPGFV